MEFVGLITQSFNLAAIGVLFLILSWRLLFCFWISPTLAYRKLKKNGFGGPPPSFPLGNISEMQKKNKSRLSSTHFIGSSRITHDIHSLVLPYFAKWQKSHGKVFIYWVGTEPFLYVADPEFLKKMSSQVKGKDWGKPAVFKFDRKSMFGNSLVMTEGEEWVRHRHLLKPVYNPINLKAMTSIIVESTMKMLDKWSSLIDSGNSEIDVDKEIRATAGEIIARMGFGVSCKDSRLVFENLKALQMTLFMSNRFVGVPFSNLFYLKQNLKAKRLGKEIDKLFFSIIDDRKKSVQSNSQQHNLFDLLMKESQVEGGLGKTFTTRELVDECKTFFYGGQETLGLAITWTLLLLAIHPEWQVQLREEITQVIGEKEVVDATLLAQLRKMGWVMNEVSRLYPAAPNVQRQARGDIRVNDYHLTIPDGTNIWIDIVAMHHDLSVWGEDVNEFKPQRFKDDINGGRKHKMGYLPFGFGGRTCIGRNLSSLEYKIVLTLILSRFSFTLSPNYCHSFSILISMKPTHGLPLLFQPL